jgi:hypothetical protein
VKLVNRYLLRVHPDRDRRRGANDFDARPALAGEASASQGDK